MIKTASYFNNDGTVQVDGPYMTEIGAITKDRICTQKCRMTIHLIGVTTHQEKQWEYPNENFCSFQEIC